MSAAARLAVTLDLPTPPLPEPTQITFLTCASAPSGSVPRPSLRPSAAFSLSDRTSKLTLTPVTPSSLRTASATPVWKWLRIGQPGVVSETITSTTPFSWISTDRTISSSTMSRRSSGSITARRESITWSLVGMQLIVGSARPRPEKCETRHGGQLVLKDRRAATCVTARRLREERVLHSPARI